MPTFGLSLSFSEVSSALADMAMRKVGLVAVWLSQVEATLPSIAFLALASLIDAVTLATFKSTGEAT
ncbi:hypothetical protein D3C72_361950 [compost metagenome]